MKTNRTQHDPAFYLVIDLEATTDLNNRTVPRDEMEVIEIGAVLVEGASLEPVDELQTFVRPIRHPILTPFCRELTTIRQHDVDSAPLFPVALEKLRALIGGRDALFCSWGGYDRRQLEQDAEHHRVSLPFQGRHLNLKEQFSERRGERRKYGMDGALQKVGLPLEGTHHRGIDDARNIVRLLPWSLGRVARTDQR